MFIEKEKFNEMSEKEVLRVIDEFNKTNTLGRHITYNAATKEFRQTGKSLSGDPYERIVSLADRKNLRDCLMSNDERCAEANAEGIKCKVNKDGYIEF